MAEIAFQVYNPDGSPNNSLTKNNVSFKDKLNNDAIVPYSQLNKMSNYGNYVANGFTGWNYCWLFIDDVPQYWFGTQWIGEPSSAFIGKTGNETISGIKDFSDEIKLKSISEHSSGAGLSANNLLYAMNGIAVKNGNLDLVGHDITYGNNIYANHLKPNNSDYNALTSDERFVVSKGITINGNPVLHESTVKTRLRCDEPVFLDGNAGSAQYGNMAVNKNWVKSEIQNTIQPFINGNYQESHNIVRLMPDSISSYGINYATWFDVLNYCSTTASDMHYYTMAIPGAGNNAQGITMTKFNGKFVSDYVHIRGWGSGISIVSDANIQDGEFEATNIGYVIVEDINFIFLNILMNNDAYFKKIVFKNCTFAGYFKSCTFTDCLFLGTTYFDPALDDKVIFINSTGIIHSTKNVIKSGTDYPTVYTKTSLGIGEYTLSAGSGCIETSEFKVNGVASVGQFLLGNNNLEDTGEGVGFSKGIDAYGNVNMLSATSINMSATTISLTGGVNIQNNLTVNGESIIDKLRITQRTIASSNDSGKSGEICCDDNYMYYCFHTDTWIRQDLSTWQTTW